jgi:Caspase domain
MSTTAEPGGGRRIALVVATGSYADATLALLRAPGRDASGLAEVLRDDEIGGFDVETVLDAPADVLRRRVARFCAQGAPGDLALVYLSCHGVLDDRGRLYYATTDTDRALLSATAIPAAWLNEQLEDCRCRRQILMLDCCHSGAFAKGAKGEGGLALRERFEGRGRVVLTASRGTEYSFEGGEVHGDGVSSVFTGVLVDGLRSGDADRDRDGLVTVGELYDYAYGEVRSRDGRQNPTLWTYGAEGDMLVAQSPRGAVVEPAPLPEDLVALLESARPRVREGAIAELADLVAGPDPGRALAARVALERMAAEDIPSVAEAARTALGAEGAAAAADPADSPPARAAPAPAADVPAPSPPPGGRAAGPRRPWRRTPVLAAGLAGVALVALAVVLLTGGEPPTPPGAIAVPGSPRGIAVGEGAVWVARHDADKVSRLDPTSGTASIKVPAPERIAVGEGSVWVVAKDGRQLVRIDPRTRKVTKRIAADVRQGDCGCPPGSLAIADGLLFAAVPRKGSVVRYDVTTGEEKGTYAMGPGFAGYFAVGGGMLWAVENADTGGGSRRSRLQSIDLNSGKHREVNLGTESSLSGVAYGEGVVWMADEADARNVVTRYNPQGGEVTNATGCVSCYVAKIPTGVSGDDIAVAPGVVLVWEPGGGQLTRVDSAKLVAGEPQTPRGYPKKQTVNGVSSNLAVANGSAWVTDPAAGLVHKLDY